MAAIPFDASKFKTRYPEFTAVDDGLLEEFFTEACLYLANADSPVTNESTRRVLLNMLVAHIASLAGVLSADGKPSPVGRVASAGEGSVNASFDYQAPGTAAWFAQTQYGAAFWQATSSYRSFIYVSCPTRY